MEERRKNPPVIDPAQPVCYTERETPSNYICHNCGAGGCKLWREYQTFLNNQTLLCARCAAIDQKKDIAGIDAAGTYESSSGGRIDQIGWLVPAVPTEENNTFWGYTSVPQEGCEWWKNLPTLSQALTPNQHS